MDKNHNIHAAKSLLEFYGYDSLSYFALHEKKRYFFSSTGKSFLSYSIWKSVALVSGDPVGPKPDFRILLREFTYFLKGARLTCCFIGLHKNSLPYVAPIGYKTMHVGDEAVLTLAKYKKNSLKKKVRRAEKHIRNLGITCIVFKRSNIPDFYFNQIQDISAEWLKHKGNRERGFSMTLGRIPNINDQDCEFVLAVDSDLVLGYLTFVPAYASHCYSLDLSRRRNKSPNGLTEFLLLNAFEYFKKKKVKSISLNFATFYHDKEYNSLQINQQIKKIIYNLLSFLYGTDKLYKFNKKFLPEWHSRYISFERKRYIPRYINAVMKLEL